MMGRRRKFYFLGWPSEYYIPYSRLTITYKYHRHYPLQQNFRPSASQALHKALKRGRLEKVGGKYRLNPSWGGGPTVCSLSSLSTC